MINRDMQWLTIFNGYSAPFYTFGTFSNFAAIFGVM